ncbi:MAG: RtcB family protein [Clostridiales bacterium]|nr:RtcB family protein [Clostridiales bacterium]
MAYKSVDDIVNNIKDTVKIVKMIKPIYNFKAGE